MDIICEWLVPSSLDVPPEGGLVRVVLLAVLALERGRPLPPLERDVRSRAVTPVGRLVREGPRADLQRRTFPLATELKFDLHNAVETA